MKKKMALFDAEELRSLRIVCNAAFAWARYELEGTYFRKILKLHAETLHESPPDSIKFDHKKE